ncbi:MAG: hypothetical protein GY807_17040 [Gammaproteobacteria bacterium]|nr:hypothetical protein [Gammaproteobacteria bacterium]
MRIKTVRNYLIVGAMVITTSACSTIKFYNDEAKPDAQAYSEYHHMAGLDLVEVSDPVDMRQRCDGEQWQYVTTERTFANGVVSALTQPFYSPWEVSYGCASQ